jgi:hypothetical protein
MTHRFGSVRLQWVSLALALLLTGCCRPPAATSGDIETFDRGCGLVPQAPVIPSPTALSSRTTDAAHAVVRAALQDIRSYQGALTVFRDCLTSQTASGKGALARARRKGNERRTVRIAQELEDLTAEYDRTIDDEMQVVMIYVDLHNAYCAMGQYLAGCPRPRYDND